MKDTINGLRLGVEIEAEINSLNIKEIECGEYHNAKELFKYWLVEHDGSLSKQRWRSSYTREFKTVTLGNVSYLSAVRQFIKAFKTRTKDKPLKEILDFNNSCGCHIHFSVRGDQNLKNKLLKYEAEELKIIACKHLKKSGFSEDKIEAFKKHYYRDYARKPALGGGRNRYDCLNQNTRGTSTEWRGFNLIMVKTWGELEKALLAAKETVTDFLRNRKGNVNVKVTLPTVRKETNIDGIRTLEEENGEERSYCSVCGEELEPEEDTLCYDCEASSCNSCGEQHTRAELNNHFGDCGSCSQLRQERRDREDREDRERDDAAIQAAVERVRNEEA